MNFKIWWEKRSYEFKGGIIGLVIAILSVVIMSSANILPSNFLSILEATNYATFWSSFKIMLLYYSILTLVGALIGFIIRKVRRIF